MSSNQEKHSKGLREGGDEKQRAKLAQKKGASSVQGSDVASNKNDSKLDKSKTRGKRREAEKHGDTRGREEGWVGNSGGQMEYNETATSTVTRRVSGGREDNGLSPMSQPRKQPTKFDHVQEVAHSESERQFPGAVAVEGIGADTEEDMGESEHEENSETLSAGENNGADVAFIAEARVVEDDDRTELHNEVDRLRTMVNEMQTRDEQTRNTPVVQGEAVPVASEAGPMTEAATDEEQRSHDTHKRKGADGNWFQRQPRWLWLVVAIVVVATGVGAGVGISQSNNDTQPSSIAPQTAPTTSPSLESSTTTPSPTMPSPLSLEATVELVEANSFDGGAALSDPSSPQSEALQWLLSNSGLDDYSDRRKMQRFALATLYFSTNGDGWKNSTGWLSNSHECDWHISSRFYGPLCSDGEFVSTIFLQQENLVGTLPPDLALLSDSILTILLEWNFLSGPIPTEFGLLTKLGFLDLGPNRLSSSIPSEIAGMTSLNWLSFGENDLTGNVPSEINQMTKLDYLNIQDNNFSPPFTCPGFISTCWVSCEDPSNASCREL